LKCYLNETLISKKEKAAMAYFSVMQWGTPRARIARILIGFVLLLNVQCALAFLTAPDRYAPGFEMEGAVGAGMVRGMGILFLMWNVPYFIAAADPVRRRVSLFEAVTMQAIGFTGESLLLATFPPGHFVIRATIERFFLFDGLGLLALLLAAWLTRKIHQS
jgi:hypothetical protein